MEMKGERQIPVNQSVVWKALNDPEVLRASVPGCESLEEKGNDEYQATILAAVGPVRARFQGNMAIVESNPPTSYKLRFEGQGGAAGFANGEASVHLEPDGDQTILNYVTEARIGGKLAQIGSRMIEGTARKMADEFFDNFINQLTSPEPAHQKPSAAAKQIPSWVWPAVGIVIAAIAIAYALVD